MYENLLRCDDEGGRLGANGLTDQHSPPVAPPESCTQWGRTQRQKVYTPILTQTLSNGVVHTQMCARARTRVLSWVELFNVLCCEEVDKKIVSYTAAVLHSLLRAICIERHLV